MGDGGASVTTVLDAIVIGASAGAIEALGAMLPALPADLPVPVVVVVHVPARRPSLLVDLFRAKCALEVAEPVDKEPVRPGVVWFAPPDYHLLVEDDRTFAFSIEPPVHYSRPSIDALFESAAATYGARVLGIVLTGASSDGAAGARAIRAAGGFVAVEDPETAESKVMPHAARTAADPQFVGTPRAIADFALRTLYGTPS